MPNTKEDNVDRKLITNITIDGLEYELIHIPKEVKDAWEKTKQPNLEYEIISVKERNNKDNIIECKYRGMFNPDYYEIHSVKRLSDNLIFELHKTKVVDPNTKHEWVISDISLKDNQIYFNGVWINHVQLAKQILFTTQDGKDIYEGDGYVKVNNYSDYSIVTSFTAHGNHDDYKGLKFSTVEAANEYVTLHKPVLSAQDIIDYFESWVVKPSEYTKNIIIKLAKQKINGI